MSCSFCSEEKIYAKGYCRKCYMRVLRTGSPEYTRNFIKTDSHCSIENCFYPVKSKGLCGKHYMMTLRKNNVYSDFGYGERKKHPLYETWRYQTRSIEGRCKEWNDFWQFVCDVGEKPSNKHRAYRHDINRPWSKNNFYWKETYSSSLDKKEYQKQWRLKNKIQDKSNNLKSCYGITFDDYMEIYNKQNGCCLICGTKKDFISEKNKSNNVLAVDHCHISGRIRGLLCSCCNKSLGGFKDNIDILNNAILYLSLQTV